MTKKIAQKPELEDIDPAEVPEIEVDEDGNPIEETAASDSIKAKGTPSRLDIMTNTVSAMAKMGDDELTKWWAQAVQTSQGYSATGLDASDKNKASLNMKPSATGANPMGPFPYVPVVKEDLAVVFDGLELKEGMLDKALLIFESALNARLILESERLQEQFDERLVEAIEEIRTDLTEKVDQYLDYASQEFVKENEIAIESGLKLELFEDFMEGFKNLCEEHYVSFPEEKYDVLEGLSEKVVELESKLNEAIEGQRERDNKINEMIAQQAFIEVSEGLSVTDTEKFKTLVESVEFDGDVDALKQKLTIIKEANFKGLPKKPAKTGIIQEESVVITGDVDADGSVQIKDPDPRVASYVKAISKTIKR